jgi:hypothetical protein
VGDAANCLIGPPSPFPLPPAGGVAGGGRGVKSGLSEINFAGRQPRFFPGQSCCLRGRKVGSVRQDYPGIVMQKMHVLWASHARSICLTSKFERFSIEKNAPPRLR